MIILLTLMNVFFICFGIYCIKNTESKIRIYAWSVISTVHFSEIVIRTIKYWNI